ncbi:MAG: hypothetical protein JW889_12810 [Verrucomicrobia bacterium]|nr:hypothetical protein [Verrucomicrobiota bacterium]
MEFFDQFNLAQKIVLLVMALVLMVFLFAQPGAYVRCSSQTDVYHTRWAEFLGDALGIVLAGIIVTAGIGLVRSELAKRKRAPGDAEAE